MIVDKNYLVKITYHNINYYKQHGFQNLAYGDFVDVNVFDIHPNSCMKIDVKCDYCDDVIFQKMFQAAIVHDMHFCHSTDACKAAHKKYSDDLRKATNMRIYGAENVWASDYGKAKIKQTNLNKYGYECASQSPEVKAKMAQTCMDLYGYPSTFQVPKIQEKIAKTNLELYGAKNVWASEYGKKKIKQTNLEKRGVEQVMQDPEVQAKIAETNMKKWGVENVFAAEPIKEKIKLTNLDRYGVEHPLQNEKLRNKAHQTFIEQSHGTGVFTSQQQEFIWLQIGGKLNYKVIKKAQDISFPEEMIYVEYDGGGHEKYCIKFKNMTHEEFLQYEYDREQFFFNLGWKIIRVIDTKTTCRDYEKILSDIKIRIDYAKSILKTTDINKVIINYNTYKIIYGDKEEDF